MPRPWRIRYGGAIYHVTARGNARRVIFRQAADYCRFLEQLEEAVELDGVRLYAYVLMPNHYHLVVETPMGNIQRFMQRLNTAYGMYFRFKHSEPGHCFQGRYGAKLVKGDDYLVRVIRYVHLNPIKVKAWKAASVAVRMRELGSYRWSSYGGYVDGKRAEGFIDYKWLKLMGCKTEGGNRRAYRRYAESMVAASDADLTKAMDAGRYAIGDEEFREEVAGALKEARLRKGVYGRDVMWPEGQAVAIEEVEKAVCEEYGILPAGLRSRARAALEARKVFVELASRAGRQRQRAIGRYLGYTSDSAVGKQRQALRKDVARLPAIAARIERLCKRIGCK